jgi:hypothetical protein
MSCHHQCTATVSPSHYCATSPNSWWTSGHFLPGTDLEIQPGTHACLSPQPRELHCRTRTEPKGTPQISTRMLYTSSVQANSGDYEVKTQYQDNAVSHPPPYCPPVSSRHAVVQVVKPNQTQSRSRNNMPYAHLPICPTLYHIGAVWPHISCS